MPNTNRIRGFLDRITPERIEEIRNEIQEKEDTLIHEAEDGNRLDETHKEMVLNYIRDNLIPEHPTDIQNLMLQFISSAFSYSVLREELKRQFLELCHQDRYPILRDHMILLSRIFNENRFEIENFWEPNSLLELATEIQNQRQYDLNSRSPFNRIISILLTAPQVISQLFENNLNEKYEEIEALQNITDPIERATALWVFAENLHNHDDLKIKNVGTVLVCDFLKECGFKQYAKIDVQMIRAIRNIIGEEDVKFNNFELFVGTQWIAEKIDMTPFKLDKILYIYGKYF